MGAKTTKKSGYMGLRLDDDVLAWVGRAAARKGISRSEFVRRFLHEGFERRRKEA